MLYSVILALVSINFCTAASRLQIRFPCNDQEALCVPAELRKLKAPSIDSGIDGLLHDLLISIGLTSIAERDVKQVEGTLVKRAPTDHVCCKSGFIHQPGKRSNRLDRKCRPIRIRLLLSQTSPVTVLLCKHLQTSAPPKPPPPNFFFLTCALGRVHLRLCTSWKLYWEY